MLLFRGVDDAEAAVVVLLLLLEAAVVLPLRCMPVSKQKKVISKRLQNIFKNFTHTHTTIQHTPVMSGDVPAKECDTCSN